MGTGQKPPLASLVAGALEWWRDAGVDRSFGDDTTAWLAAKESEAAPVPEPVRMAPPPRAQPRARRIASEPAARVDTGAIPSELAAFRAWWMTDPALPGGNAAMRVPPRGATGAKLMVIVPEPEREDRDRLLTGPQGKLLDAMLGAFGLAESDVYLASAIPRHLPGADWDGLAGSGLDSVLTRHIALVAPERLIVFGASILPLLSHSPPQRPADLRIFNHEDSRVPMLACRSLAALLEQPRWKAKVWECWLEMTG